MQGGPPDESMRDPRRILLLSLAVRARSDWETVGSGVGWPVELVEHSQVARIVAPAAVVVAGDKGDGVEGVGRGHQTGRVGHVDHVDCIEVRDRIDYREDDRRTGREGGHTGDGWREGDHTERVGCIVGKGDHIVENVAGIEEGN